MTEDDILCICNLQNIIEIYKTSKRYVPAFMCRRFSNGYPNFNFDYYHFILEVRHILFNTEDDIYFLTQKTTFKASLRWILVKLEQNLWFLFVGYNGKFSMNIKKLPKYAFNIFEIHIQLKVSFKLLKTYFVRFIDKFDSIPWGCLRRRTKDKSDRQIFQFQSI